MLPHTHIHTSTHCTNMAQRCTQVRGFSVQHIITYIIRHRVTEFCCIFRSSFFFGGAVFFAACAALTQGPAVVPPPPPRVASIYLCPRSAGREVAFLCVLVCVNNVNVYPDNDTCELDRKALGRQGTAYIYPPGFTAAAAVYCYCKTYYYRMVVVDEISSRAMSILIHTSYIRAHGAINTSTDYAVLLWWWWCYYLLLLSVTEIHTILRSKYIFM